MVLLNVKITRDFDRIKQEAEKGKPQVVRRPYFSGLIVCVLLSIRAYILTSSNFQVINTLSPEFA